VADLTSLAMELSSSVEIPKPPGEQKASPESLRRTRLGLGRLDLDMFAPGVVLNRWIEHLGKVIVNRLGMYLIGLNKNRWGWRTNG